MECPEERGETTSSPSNACSCSGSYEEERNAESLDPGDGMYDEKKKKQRKTERELKRLAFDNKKFKVDASDAEFICVYCDSTFLYDTQLQSHGVYAHSSPNALIIDAPHDHTTQAPLHYRCAVCSSSMSNIQTYLQHVKNIGCRSEKRRLKALDSCVCLLCGYATTRNQLHTHLRDGHRDMPALEPTNEADDVYSCPMCTLDGGGVVVAASNDLLLHLSTWHPTAIILERASLTEEQSATGQLQKEDWNGNDGITNSINQRCCIWCGITVPGVSYSQHKRKCLHKPHGHTPQNKRKSIAKPNRMLAKKVEEEQRPVSSLSPPSFHFQPMSPSEKAMTSVRALSADVSDLVDGNTFQREERMQSTPSSAPAADDVYDKVASPLARIPKAWKKPYSCFNCRKEFPEPLSYFIHSVSQFCRGNRGTLLESSFCPLCSEPIKTVQLVLDHVRRRHCDWDGLRVDKVVRVEFSELASEIIGFTHVCTKCSRGFYAKSRCNPARPHLGSKVPIQQLVICNLCNRRLKSGPQLTLHLWAMHKFAIDDIAKPVTTKQSCAPGLVKLESISDYVTLRTFANAEKSTYNPETEVQSLLKCSLCTTKFASLAALEAHNKEFHEGLRRDDPDFQLIAKVFFYRQNEPGWKERSLFDDLLVNASEAVFRRVNESSPDECLGRISAGPNPFDDQLPVELSQTTRKRKRTDNIKQGANDAPETRIALPSGTSDPSGPSSTAVVVTPTLPMPRLIRFPVAAGASTANNANAIQAQQYSNVRILGANSVSSSVFSLANTAIPCARKPAQTSSTPVLIRAFSLRSESTRLPQMFAPRPPYNYLVGNNAVSIRPNMYNNLGVKVSSTPTASVPIPRLQYYSPAKVERKIAAAPRPRYQTPVVIQMTAPQLAIASTTTAPRLLIRPVRPADDAV